jgi:hypothetical protein
MGFDVLMAVTTNITVFLDVIVQSGTCLPDYMASHHRRPYLKNETVWARHSIYISKESVQQF